MNQGWLSGLIERYPQPGGVLLATGVLSFLLTGLFYFLAKRGSLLPDIRDRDVHTVRKPRVGGVAMWLAVFLAFGWLLGRSGDAHLLAFGGRRYFGIDAPLLGIMTGMAVLLVCGLIDDIRGLSWKGQLAGQFLAALCLVAFGVGASYLQLPFHHQLPLDRLSLDLGLPGGPLMVWSAVFTVFWVMLMINVLNWFDGLDGLAGSIAVTASLALFLVSVRVGFLATATLSLITAGAAAGFLPWNWHPSRLFMGTVGSQLLGFLLGTTAIISGGKVATAVLVLGIPVLDALIVIFRRLRAGVSPFYADQRHLHHRLLKVGLPVPWVVVCINGVALLFGYLAVRTQETNEKGILAVVLVLCMVAFIGATYILEKRSGLTGKKNKDILE